MSSILCGLDQIDIKLHSLPWSFISNTFFTNSLFPVVKGIIPRFPGNMLGSPHKNSISIPFKMIGLEVRSCINLQQTANRGHLFLFYANCLHWKNGDILHEMSHPVYWKNNKNISVCRRLKIVSRELSGKVWCNRIIHVCKQSLLRPDWRYGRPTFQT